MKKIKTISGLVILSLIIVSFVITDSYKDSTYTGISRSIYTSEDYYGKASLTFNDNELTNFDFKIVDSANHEVFDENYEDHYIGNEEYIQQCRDNWAGLQEYIEDFEKNMDIDDVDAITDATWAYNLFVSSVSEAMELAELYTTDVVSVKNNASIHVYSDPVNSNVIFKYNLSGNNLVKLRIYDVQGKMITVPVNENQSSGEYKIIINDINENGVYIYYLQIENDIYNGKIFKI